MISIPLSIKNYGLKGLFISLIFVIAIGLIDRYYKSKNDQSRYNYKVVFPVLLQSYKRNDAKKKIE